MKILIAVAATLALASAMTTMGPTGRPDRPMMGNWSFPDWVTEEQMGMIMELQGAIDRLSMAFWDHEDCINQETLPYVIEDMEDRKDMLEESLEDCMDGGWDMESPFPDWMDEDMIKEIMELKEETEDTLGKMFKNPDCLNKNNAGEWLASMRKDAKALKAMHKDCKDGGWDDEKDKKNKKDKKKDKKKNKRKNKRD